MSDARVEGIPVPEVACPEVAVQPAKGGRWAGLAERNEVLGVEFFVRVQVVRIDVMNVEVFRRAAQLTLGVTCQVLLAHGWPMRRTRVVMGEFVIASGTLILSGH